MTKVKTTPLHQHHHHLGAKMVAFSGWKMPLLYKGVIHEHHTVRQKVGVFDVSHMGRIVIQGKDTASFLNFIGTNEIVKKADYSAIYTVLCNEEGKAIDDILIYKENNHLASLVVNAGNREKDLKHLQEQARGYDISIEARYDHDGILALQGPLSKEILVQLFPQVKDLNPMCFLTTEYLSKPILIARTGYTGSMGYECILPLTSVTALWERLFDIGDGVLEPIGLAARDTLRLEKGFALYGHELSLNIAPSESVAKWTIRWEKENFLGKAALLNLEKNAAKRYQYGMILEDQGIAREGCIVLQDNQEIGVVTSGTLSPTLNQAIAIILVNRSLEKDSRVEIKVRNRLLKAKIAAIPFI